MIVALSAMTLGACDRAITGPDTGRALRAPAAAAHDDDPPDTTCRSGWIVIEGRWTCNDG
jgi:hypothetical protein